MKKYERHPLSETFPIMDGDQFKEFGDDIEANGLQEDIVLYEGKVLDGWNRYRACLDRKITARFHDYTGSTPVAYVISANIRRRHLSVVQRLRHLEDLREQIAAEANERQRRGGRKKGENESDNTVTLAPNGATRDKTSSTIAEMAGTSSRTVERYHAVQENGTAKLKEAVDSEVVSIADAAAVADESPEVQDKAVDAKRSGKARTAKEGAAKAKRGRKKKPESGEAELKEDKAKEPEKDAVGIPLDAAMVKVFSIAERFKKVRSLLKQAAQEINEIANAPGGEKYRRELQLTGTGASEAWKDKSLQEALGRLNFNEPYASVCPWCHDNHPGKFNAKCPGCNGRGWVVKQDWNRAAPEFRAAVLQILKELAS